MNFKEEKGISGIDITVSVLILTLLVAFITNISYQLDKNNKITLRKTEAIAYALSEIESIKNKGYQTEYDGKGLAQEEILQEKEIYDSNGQITGYQETILIQDYTSLAGNESKQADCIKKITIEISFKIGKQQEKVKLETLIAKEK